MSNLIKCKEYYCPIWSDEKNIVEPDQVTDFKEYCCPIARNIVVQPDERGDLLLAAHHGQESGLFHQQVLRRRPRDLAQVPTVQNCDARSCSVLQNSSKSLQDSLKLWHKVVFCSAHFWRQREESRWYIWDKARSWGLSEGEAPRSPVSKMPPIPTKSFWGVDKLSGRGGYLDKLPVLRGKYHFLKQRNM